MKWSRLAMAATILGLLACATLLFVPPPRLITRGLAAMSSSRLMNGPEVVDGRISANVTRVLGAYIQMSLAHEISDDIVARTGKDEYVLHQMMLVVRDKVLNQIQFDHIPRSWPVLVTGAGYCDQINGAVAMIAAQHFPSSQIYSLYDPTHKTTPHTIGRVWSPQRNEWLYFDAFFSRPIIFTKDRAGRPHFLPLPASRVIPSRGEPQLELFALNGWVLTSFKKGFVPYLLSRASVAQTAPPEKAAPALDSYYTAPPAPVPVSTRVSDPAFDKLSRKFVLTRIDDLLGEPVKGGYQSIAADPAALEDDRAKEVAAIARNLALVEAPRDTNDMAAGESN